MHGIHLDFVEMESEVESSKIQQNPAKSSKIQQNPESQWKYYDTKRIPCFSRARLL